MRLRIIAGMLGGRMIQAPDGFMTHPMGERVRGALFNKLGDITGKTVLDAFAGSGALGIEAVSRGAGSALLIEKDKKAQRIIAENIEALGAQKQAQLVSANCRAWSDTSVDEKFDIIFCDPPYNDVKVSTLTLLTRHMKPNSLMVLSYPGRESAPTVNGVVVVDKSDYGDAALAIYRRNENIESGF